MSRRSSTRLVLLFLALCAFGAQGPDLARAEAPSALAPRAIAAAVPADPGVDVGASAEAPRVLPAGVEPGVPVKVAVPGDKHVVVIHASADNLRPIVYLHGMCGNVRAVESWRQAAAAHGTLIGLVGDRPCGGGRFKWTKKLDRVQARIEKAVAAVRAARGGLLEPESLVLFGYSQGADRAEALAARFHDKYRLVVLGGPSREPRLRHLGGASAVAVFGGELETTGHMRAGAEMLAAAGKPVRFFLLPAAKHGEYGPEGNRVIGEVLSWIVTPHDAEPAEL